MLLNIFVETNRNTFIFLDFWWIEGSKEQHLFEIEIFCNIWSAFTVTIDEFNESLLNKSINVFLTVDLSGAEITALL